LLRKLTFKTPTSSRPGVVLEEAEFAIVGEGRVPFAGGRFVVAPNATSRPDTHDVTECWMIAKGRGIINYDGVDYPVAAGDYVLFEPRKTHFLHNNSEEAVVIHTVWWLEQQR
jgi:mannose-6-phosphate isomerase-like protein (cupin superfamily)